MSALPSRGPALDTTRPFTRSEALNQGLTDHDLSSASFVRLFRNVYVDRQTTRTLPLRAEGALRVAPPTAMASHHTAALLWGGTVPRQSAIHLTVPAGHDCRVDGIHTHRYLSVERPVLHRGLRVTSPERTVCDLARQLDLLELVILGDRLVRRGVTSPEGLVDAADDWNGPRARLLRRAMRLVRSGVDSPPESRLRLLVVLAGLPEPTVNHILRDPDTGDWRRRFELAYLELLLAIEYQGRWHRQSEEVWSSDIRRREEIDSRTWRIIEVIADDLDDDPLQTLRRIETARRERGAAAVTGFSEEWRAFFPGVPGPRPRR